MVSISFTGNRKEGLVFVAGSVSVSVSVSLPPMLEASEQTAGVTTVAGFFTPNEGISCVSPLEVVDSSRVGVVRVEFHPICPASYVAREAIALKFHRSSVDCACKAFIRAALMASPTVVSERLKALGD